MANTLRGIFEDLKKVTLYLKTDLLQAIFNIGAKYAP
jgi:hypothetical protein